MNINCVGVETTLFAVPSHTYALGIFYLVSKKVRINLCINTQTTIYMIYIIEFTMNLHTMSFCITTAMFLNLRREGLRSPEHTL